MNHQYTKILRSKDEKLKQAEENLSKQKTQANP